MPLDITIVGAGIGGLSAAVALRRGGHRVTILEKSRFKTEVGAAVVLAPNGSRVLSSLDASFEKMRPTILSSWETVNGKTLEKISSIDFADSIERYGFNVMALHRVDLHNELLRLATEGISNPASLRLNSKIVVVAEEGDKRRVCLDDGEVLKADLVIGADGVHSVVREALIEQNMTSSTTTALSAFRSLIPTEKFMAHMAQSQALRELHLIKQKGSSIYADVNTAEERHLVWYDCREGEVQNIVGIHPSRVGDGKANSAKQALLAEFDHFSPGLLELLNLAEDVACWPLYEYMPFPRWISQNIVLIGDAAHPMLPFSGQAANQALEDAGALGTLLDGVQSKNVMYERLKLYEKVRRSRVNAIQILSSARVGTEGKLDVQAKLREHALEERPPTTFQERIDHAYAYDVILECNRRLRGH